MLTVFKITEYALATGLLLYRFLGEIETDNLTASNSEIITFDFTVS